MKIDLRFASVGSRALPLLLLAATATLAQGAAAATAAPSAAAVALVERPDAAKGRKIAAEVCAPCHTADGNSVIPTNPKLAGQHAEYLVKQLTDLAKSSDDKTARENAVMSGFAGMLSPVDRESVALWFSSQNMVTGKASNAEAVRVGQKLYRAGIPEKAVPACSGCHGPAGNGLPARFPRIGGQHADYIEAQLRSFRDGSRHNNEAMSMIAFRLSDPEIKALSEFVSALQSQ